MKITLHHVKNVDLMHGQGNGSGYWDEVVDAKRITVEVSSLAEASKVFCAWRDRNGLGGGNCARDCGDVSDGGKVVARVSYNGRVWTPEPFPKCTEILVAAVA